MIATEAVVISLPYRNDRLEIFQRRWEATGLSIPLRVHEAVDGPRQFPELPRRQAAEKACYLSHQQVLLMHAGPVLVFEDDAMFVSLAPLRAPFPTGWDVLRLGGMWRDPYRRPGWYPSPSHGSHAYLARSGIALARSLALAHDQVSREQVKRPVMDLLLNRLPHSWVWSGEGVEQDHTLGSDIAGRACA